MAKGSEYWQRRFQAVEAMNNQTAQDTIRSITPAFEKAQAQIDKEINVWYERLAKNNEISLQEAKKLLNTRELKEFRWSVEEYIKYGRENAIDPKWVKELENASARFHISRLEALKIHTQNAAERAFGNELDVLDSMAAKVYMDDYYHTAYEIQRGLGVGWDVSKIDQRKLDKIVSKPWTADKMTFSDRIWKQKSSMISELHNQMTQLCILGRSPKDAIEQMERFVDGKVKNAKLAASRLVMTEAAYFGSVAQKDCFNDLDVEKYEIVATLDNRTSDVCQNMDGKVFDMKDFQAGVTAPPFHVWCRSCTAPWFEDNDDGKRAARGEDGKTYYVPANMKYQDWKEYFVDKTKDPADWLKKATVGDTVEKIKSIKDLQEYAENTLGKYGVSVDVSGSKDIDYMKESIDELYKLTGEYNTTMVSVRYKKGSINDSEGGMAYMLKGHSAVTINVQKGGVDVLGIGDKKDLRTTVHEFAHTLSQSRENIDTEFWKEIKSIKRKYETAMSKIDKAEIVEHTMTAQEAIKAKAEIKLSDYARKDVDEFLAEAFAQAKLSEHPTKYSLDVLDVVDKYFKK